MMNGGHAMIKTHTMGPSCGLHLSVLHNCLLFQEFDGKEACVLKLSCEMGLVSFVAATQGAHAAATDISHHWACLFVQEGVTRNIFLCQQRNARDCGN